MDDKKNPSSPKDSWRRSVLKAVTYRVLILAADFTAVYLLTGNYRIALGFMVVSNVYTTVLYFLHERFWNGVAWGRIAG